MASIVKGLGTAVITSPGKTYEVQIAIQSISHGLDKQLIIHPIPNQQQSDTYTILIDLQRCKEAVTITGTIVPKSGNTGLTQKKQILNMMRKKTGNYILRWGQAAEYYLNSNGSDEVSERIQGNIQKVDIKEIVGTMEGDPGNELKFYSVQFVFVRGTHRA